MFRRKIEEQLNFLNFDAKIDKLAIEVLNLNIEINKLNETIRSLCSHISIINLEKNIYECTLCKKRFTSI